MNHQSANSRELLIPILLGGFSLVGIVVVLLVGRALSAPGEIAATPSSTPFQYIYLGTEPAIATPFDDEFPPTEPPATEAPIFETPSRRPSNTPLVFRTGTSSLPATATRTSTPSAASTYDDTDSRFNYSGSWESANVPSAYQGTLHISYTVGNSMTFTFTGTEMDFYYQAGPSLGVVTIFIDDDALGITLSEAQGGQWKHTLESGTHKVVIKHTNGGSVNIDRLTFPALPARTATPTRTSTP